MDEFCRTPVTGPLPPGRFQCPACGVAWERRERGYRVLRAGNEAMVIPERVEVVVVEGVL
jgi:hypothetical protein